MLIGVGASSISRFPQGYAQNAPATSAHTAAIRDGRFSTTRGHSFTAEDKMRSRMIEMLMCDFRIDAREILRDYDITRDALQAMFTAANSEFEGILRVTSGGLTIPVSARPLTRMIARAFDAYDLSKAGHSSAI